MESHPSKLIVINKKQVEHLIQVFGVQIDSRLWTSKRAVNQIVTCEQEFVENNKSCGFVAPFDAKIMAALDPNLVTILFPSHGLVVDYNGVKHNIYSILLLWGVDEVIKQRTGCVRQPKTFFMLLYDTSETCFKGAST